MIKFLWMASDCYATTARLEIFMDKNFMGAHKTPKSTKILGYTVYVLLPKYVNIYIYIAN